MIEAPRFGSVLAWQLWSYGSILAHGRYLAALAKWQHSYTRLLFGSLGNRAAFSHTVSIQPSIRLSCSGPANGWQVGVVRHIVAGCHDSLYRHHDHQDSTRGASVAIRSCIYCSCPAIDHSYSRYLTPPFCPSPVSEVSATPGMPQTATPGIPQTAAPRMPRTATPGMPQTLDPRMPQTPDPRVGPPRPRARAVLERCGWPLGDSFLTAPTLPLGDQLLGHTANACSAAAASQRGSQWQHRRKFPSPSEDNLPATQPSEFLSLPNGRLADYGSTYDWLTVTQGQYTQEDDADHAWLRCKSEPGDSLRSDPQSPPSDLQQLIGHMAPSVSDVGDREAAVALVNDVNRGQQSASSWTSDPARALLRRHMGITADLDAKTQVQQSRSLRREVRRLSGIDYSKTWKQLENEGKTEDMIDSISPPLLLNFSILI